MTSSWDSRDKAVGFMNSLYTFVVFLISCILIGFMGGFYLVINFVRDSWLNYLEKRFPDLEFAKNTTLRSVVDTHRNMGIITLLVSVKGNCDPNLLKKRLVEDIMEKKQSDGQYVFKHLRKTLTTRWGWYAWQKLESFNIDNHLVFASPYYRGRALSDANLQECISETVSKYLVQDLPPWQITVFQLLAVEKYYVLIRFHHMLLSNEGLNLGSFFTVAKKSHDIFMCKSAAEDYENDKMCLFSTSASSRRPHIFQELYKSPRAIPTLIEQIHETFTNVWNEFVSIYDPIENPSILKNPGLKATLAMFSIVIIAVLKELIFHPFLSMKIIKNELAQKGLTWSFIIRSLWKTFNPVSFTLNLVRCAYDVFLFFIKFPLFLACEFRSFYMRNSENYEDASYVKSIFAIYTAVKNSMKEVLYYWNIMYNGPRVMLEEFLTASKCASHQLQFVSLCGRKVVSWSTGIPVEKIREIEDVTGASMSEILITATSASLRDFLVQYSLDVPETLTTTARYFPQEHLINRMPIPCSGILCLPLPIKNPFGHEYDPVTELRAVQQIVLRARLKQPALYLASLTQLQYGILTQMLPSPLLRLILNLLSRRFPIILSEVAPCDDDGSTKHYLWGQEVEDLMYWKPPQANICMTLTLMTFGNYVKLGVMADALLSPHHAVISATFAQHIWELAAAAGVTTDFEDYSFVSEDSDTPEVSRSSRNSTLSSSSLDIDLDENNLNQSDSSQKYPLRKKLQFNIPS